MSQPMAAAVPMLPRQPMAAVVSMLLRHHPKSTYVLPTKNGAEFHRIYYYHALQEEEGGSAAEGGCILHAILGWPQWQCKKDGDQHHEKGRARGNY